MITLRKSKNSLFDIAGLVESQEDGRPAGIRLCTDLLDGIVKMTILTRSRWQNF